MLRINCGELPRDNKPMSTCGQMIMCRRLLAWTWLPGRLFRLSYWQPGGTVVKNLPAKAGEARDAVSIPGLRRSPGVGNGNPFQDSCLENSMEGGTWGATYHPWGLQRHDWAYRYTQHMNRDGAPTPGPLPKKWKTRKNCPWGLKQE